MVVLWANDGKQSDPSLRFERGREDGSAEKRKTQTQLGLVRAMKTHTVVGFCSGNENQKRDLVTVG
jgi:hypothetical protein